ncbi:hypothetical protein N9W89_06720 [Hellea sp.]|nr:hypothetical protein [Hellea sp.]
MAFQRGDQRVLINGKPYGLRLTMGALADIQSRLSVRGPHELSARLRELTAADGRVLLACVMQPCLPSEGALTRPAATASEDEVRQALPLICKLFEEAFSHDG